MVSAMSARQVLIKFGTQKCFLHFTSVNKPFDMLRTCILSSIWQKRACVMCLGAHDFARSPH